MANPQTEDGHTRIANELLEAIITREWGSESPLRIVLFVMRKTYGFRKKIDVISLTQFEHGTGLARSTINRWLQALVRGVVLVAGEITKKGRTYGINKDYEQWVVAPLELVAPLHFASSTPHTYKRNNTKEIYTVASATPAIRIKNETHNMEELTYEPLDGKPKKTPYGRQTMFVLAKKFAEIADIEIKETFDASAWSKPLAAIYQYFNKDADATMAFMERAAGYFEDKNLSYTPHTLAKNIPLIEKWIVGKQEVSSRRRL